ncbi:MAG: polysaccharide biosynthesis/export family protein [Rikenellaceae bacterium]
MRKLLFAFFIALLASCATQRQISYFQDVEPGIVFEYATGKDITVQPDDVLSIVVSSKNPELAALFNLPKVQQIAGSGNSTLSSVTTTELSGYAIDSQGYINFPVVGKIYIMGQTKEEIAETIKDELISNDLIKDPIVTVNFINLTFSVLGEVSKPGQYNLEKNKTTLLEALSMAGDLTIYGQRDKVFLTRDINDRKITYQLDMRSQDIYKSPAYYVQQNDLIYVEPNKVKANQSTVNGNTVQSTSFWISIASLLTTISLIFIN